MKKQPSILIACPQHSSKRYCWDAWKDNVNSFTYPLIEVLMVDNSEDTDFQKQMAKENCYVIHIRPKNKSLSQRLAESHEQCRQFALDGAFDYLLHLESDIFPPPHIIEMLLAARKEVTAAMYHIGNGVMSAPMVQVQEKIANEHFKSVHYLSKEAAQFLDGHLKKVYHAGLGCVLIHKSILSRFKFRYEPERDYFPDTFFAMDLAAKGIPIYLDTSIICEHRNYAA